MDWIYNDGGRAQAGYAGQTRDCVARSAAIVLGKPYREMYEALNTIVQCERPRKGNTRSNAGTGIAKQTCRKFFAEQGLEWVPTMFIGSGCKTHLRADELPLGRIVVSVSRHLTAVVNGVIHDTHDCSRNERRCVYGYWQEKT